MSKKRKTFASSSDECCSSLEDGLKIVENRKSIGTLEEAGRMLKRLEGLRTAKVFLAWKVSSKFFAEDPSEATTKSIEANFAAWKELQDLREFPCCRGGACGKSLPSNRIVAVVSPLMEKKNLRKKLSFYSPMIEILLQFTEVVVDKEDDAAMQWERVRDWINVKVAYFPVLSAILDPAYLLIRGNNGAAAPTRPTLEAVLTALPVGRNADGYAVAPTAASMEVTRPDVVGHARIPDLYRFPDLADARVARVGLLVWAAQQVPVVPLDFVRLTPNATGIEWL